MFILISILCSKQLQTVLIDRVNRNVAVPLFLDLSSVVNKDLTLKAKDQNKDVNNPCVHLRLACSSILQPLKRGRWKWRTWKCRTCFRCLN